MKIRSFAMASAFAFAVIGLAAPALAADAESLAVGRCDIPTAAPVFSRLPAGLPSQWSAQAYQEAPQAGLPDLMVDGWAPEPGAADTLLGNLLDEAGVRYSGSIGTTRVSWNGEAAPLTKVVEQLVSQAGGDWSYDGSQVKLSPASPKVVSASFAAPADRDLRLATIDVLRGFDLSTSANMSTISVTGSEAEVSKAKEALRSAREITVYDVVFLRGRPDAGRYSWDRMGSKTVSAEGAGGKFVFNSREPEDLIQAFASMGDLVEDSAQSVSAPAGWSLAVPPVQCGQGEGEVVVGLKGSVDAPSLTLAGNGVDGQFDGFNIGDTLVSVSPTPENGWIRMVVVRPRVVQFTSR